MFFEYPKLLWLLVIPALLVLRYLYVELKDRRPHLRVSSLTPWKKGGKTVLGVIRHIPFALRVAALSLIVVAIARPRSSTKVERVDTEGIDIVLAMDVSTSMLARDFTPTASAPPRTSPSSSSPRDLPTGWESWCSPARATRSVR